MMVGRGQVITHCIPWQGATHRARVHDAVVPIHWPTPTAAGQSRILSILRLFYLLPNSLDTPIHRVESQVDRSVELYNLHYAVQSLYITFPPFLRGYKKVHKCTHNCFYSLCSISLAPACFRVELLALLYSQYNEENLPSIICNIAIWVWAGRGRGRWRRGNFKLCIAIFWHMQSLSNCPPLAAVPAAVRGGDRTPLCFPLVCMFPWYLDIYISM